MQNSRWGCSRTKQNHQMNTEKQKEEEWSERLISRRNYSLDGKGDSRANNTKKKISNNYEFMRSTVCNSPCNRARCRGPVALLVRRPSGRVQYLFQEVDDIWCTGSNSCDRPFPKHPSAQHSRRSFRRWHTSDWH